MATLGQVCYNYFGMSTFDITQDLVKQVSGDNAYFVKLGIQAPPGTTLTLNDDKKILIGRTGTYELDEPDVVITSLKFEKKENEELYNIVVDYIYEGGNE